MKKHADSFREAQAQLRPAVEAVGRAAPGVEWEDAVLELSDAIRAASAWVEHGRRGPERDALLAELLEADAFYQGLNLPNLWEQTARKARHHA